MEKNLKLFVKKYMIFFEKVPFKSYFETIKKDLRIRENKLGSWKFHIYKKKLYILAKNQTFWTKYLENWSRELFEKQFIFYLFIYLILILLFNDVQK